MTPPSYAATADSMSLDGAPDKASDDAPDDARLMAHDYDGIREYDNPLPSWWSLAFGATIVFAFLYFAYYDIAGWGRSPAETYKVALAGWQASYRPGPAVAVAPTSPRRCSPGAPRTPS